MISARLLALAAVAFSFVAAQDSATIDDKSTAWTFSAGSTRVNDTNSLVRGGSYTVIPVGGSAEVTFVGSGGSVYTVSPKGAKGEVRFFRDGEDAGSLENVNPSPETQYNGRFFSSHGSPVGSHTWKIVAQSMPIGIDALLFNPGPASPADPED